MAFDVSLRSNANCVSRKMNNPATSEKRWVFLVCTLCNDTCHDLTLYQIFLLADADCAAPSCEMDSTESLKCKLKLAATKDVCEYADCAHNLRMAGNLNSRALRVAELIRAGTNKSADIIAAINQHHQFAYDKERANKSAQLKAFKRDLYRLRSLGQRFVYDRARSAYVEQADSQSLVALHLDDDELTVLAQLRDLHHFTPYRAAAETLYDKLAKLIAPESRRKLSRRPTIRMSLPVLDELSQHVATARMIQQASQEQRELDFKYQMAGHQQPYDMHVEVLSPLELREGHVYFDAYSLKTEVERTFRLSRIVPGSAKIQPAKRPSRTRRDTHIKLQYWLASAIEPTKHFPIHFTVDKQTDGSIVSATIDERELFRAAKILLRYGQNCIVLQPPELVDEVRRNVEAMAKHYGLLE